MEKELKQDSLSLKHILNCFKIDTQDISFRPVESGYINDTFIVLKSKQPLYILQRINTVIFKDVEKLMQNIEIALASLKASDYSTISLVKTKKGKPFYKQDNAYWRVMTFIIGSTTHNTTNSPKIAFEAGRIISKFHQLLQPISAETFTDSICNFNNLPFRITEFNTAISVSSEEKKEIAKNEIAFAKKNLPKFDAFYTAKLQVRICHNDTKLNNILFNKKNEALCLIDLDTIMKGYFHYDFGDAVRTIVNTAKEDEKDLSKITFNKTLFEAFIDGLRVNNFSLSKLELKFLPISVALMPFMHGLRALSDYLNGNIYYKVTYETQNLDRCKSLFYFSDLALQQESYMKGIIEIKLKELI